MPMAHLSDDLLNVDPVLFEWTMHATKPKPVAWNNSLLDAVSLALISNNV